MRGEKASPRNIERATWGVLWCYDSAVMVRTLLILAALAATGCSSLSQPDERRVYKEPPKALVAPAVEEAPAVQLPGLELPPGMPQLQAPARPPGSGG
jgi:hypothetical protein